MKRIYLLSAIVIAGLLAGLLASCRFNCAHGSGNVISENRKVDGFDRIDISGGFKVVLKQDSSLSVKITADDNLLQYIKSSSNGNMLHIYSHKSFCNSGEIVIHIGVKRLREIEASGAVKVESDGKINTGDLRLKLSGATKISLDLNAGNVITSGSGVTELNLKGQATSHHIELNGSGTIHALDFVTGDCDIETSGIGHSEVNVLHNLNVHSSGASDVKYRGMPTITNDKSGVSSIEQVN